ncbi:MAG TPA: DUF1566 domain-containing protein [Pyrinomonadaceae bacterium]|nr:DUF1566 domain-containing protein [Pyrinomonadaceae bacterium]
MTSPAKKRLNESHNVVLRIAILLALTSIASTAFGQDAWDQTSTARFQVIAPLASQAVLDRDTNLVWERSPSTGAFTWFGAHDRCNRLVVGNRMGWRVPTIQELTSILSIGSAPDNLELGHPFINPPTLGLVIWSSTASAVNANNAWGMNLPGNVGGFPKGSLARCWCVRFRQGPDTQ